MTISKKLSLAFLTIVSGVCLTSCFHGVAYHKYADVDAWNWNNSDTLTFELPRTTSSGELMPTVGVRTTNSFPFRMLHLQFLVSCDNEVVAADTVFVAVYDNNGQPVGKGFPYTTTLKPLQPLHVDSGKVYTFCINHIMNEECVKGVTKVGIELDMP